MSKNQYVNPANAVTAARYLTLPPFLYCVDAGWRDVAVLVVLVCGLLDKLDGLAAKVFDCKTAFGSLFDAITDAACYGFFLVVLVAYGWVPWIPVAVVLGMGGLNSFFRGVYAKRAGEAVNYRSFATERVVAFAAYLAGSGAANYLVDYLFYSCAAIITVVVLHDAKRMLIDPIEPASKSTDSSEPVAA